MMYVPKSQDTLSAAEFSDHPVNKSGHLPVKNQDLPYALVSIDSFQICRCYCSVVLWGSIRLVSIYLHNDRS